MENNSKIIIDSGPLVAFLNNRDQFHKWTKLQLSTLKPPLLTCEAVLSETCFLLQNFPEAKKALFECFQRNLIRISFKVADEITAIKTLFHRYENVPMSFADACLVRMTEQYGDSIILTLDSDFHIYRKHGRQVIPCLIPK